MGMSAASIGVWFNGNDHLYLRKISHPDGRITFTPLPNIPRAGQSIEDIGLYARRDLVPPDNLKATFRDIRNHLAGMTTGITRDEALAQQIINILFCKLLDEQEASPEEMVTFRAGVADSDAEVKNRITALFEKVKEVAYGEVFEPGDSIKLDAASISYVVGELQNYCLLDAGRDAIGEAFEVFIGPALRGAEGQFFTPRNVVDMIVRIVSPEVGERVIDPACGSGGFLIASLMHVWGKLRERARKKGWSDAQLARKELEVATNMFRGIDKDSFLVRVCKAYMALIGDGRGGIFCNNTLDTVASWPQSMQDAIPLGSFDVVLTNPPFGKKITVEGTNLLSQFDLARKWRRQEGEWEPTDDLRDKVPPQILFIERCVQLLKKGGRLGIVLPESVFGNPSHAYIVRWLLGRVRVQAVVSMPEALFKTSGKGGTHTKVCVVIGKTGRTNLGDPIFMGEAKWCGHDSRGNPTVRNLPDGSSVVLDEVPEIADRYEEWKRDPENFSPDHRGFVLKASDIHNRIFVPRYYNPEIAAEFQRLSSEYDFISLGDLIERGAVSLATGVEVGKMAYGTGTIPFIRTSDLSNWEIKADFKHGVSDAIYEE